MGLRAGDCRRGVPLWAGAAGTVGDISLWSGAFDAVGDRNPVPGRAACPRPERHAPGRVECPRTQEVGRSDSAGRSAGGDGGVKRWVHHSWEEGLCLGRVVTGVRVLMWWLVSRIRLSLRCRGVGRLFLLD